LTGQEGKEGRPEGIGRSWGVANRKGLPMADRVVHSLTPGPWTDDARQLAKQQWPGLSDYGPGFTLFVDNPKDWAACVVALEERDCYGVLPDDESVLMPVRDART
jgi:hypothetical protein